MLNINQKGIISWILIAVMVLSLIGIGVAVYLTKSYTRFLPKAANESVGGEASLSLAPTSLSANKGCEFNLDINVNTGGANTSGTDAVIKFNPALLTALSVENGSFYPTYPGNVVDNTSGKVLVSGISSTSGSINGQGKLASVKFKVNPEATSAAARVYFDFDPQNPTKTNDSNIVEAVNITELLKSVTDSLVTIGSGSSCSETVPPTPTPVPTSNPTPNDGAEVTTIIENGKAVVSFKNIIEADRLDKLEFVQSQSGTTVKKLISTLYTANCSTEEPASTVQPKSSGTCYFTIPVTQGEYQARLYQKTAESNRIKDSSQPPAAATNLLTNPSMEQLTGNYPTGWFNRPNATSDTSSTKTGSRSLKVVGPSTFVYSQQSNTLQPNTQYTASVWVKTQNVSGKGVGIRYAQLSPSSYVLGQILNIKDATNWKQISFTFNTPTSYANGRMDLIWELNSGATVWFDDAAICKGTSPCP